MRAAQTGPAVAALEPTADPLAALTDVAMVSISSTLNIPGSAVGRSVGDGVGTGLGWKVGNAVGCGEGSEVGCLFSNLPFYYSSTSLLLVSLDWNFVE